MYENKARFIDGLKSKPDPQRVKELEKMLGRVEKLVKEHELYETLKQFNDKFKNKS